MNNTQSLKKRVIFYGLCTILAVVVYFTLGSLLPPVLRMLDPSLVRWTVVPAWLLATVFGLGCYAAAQSLSSHRTAKLRPGGEARESASA